MNRPLLPSSSSVCLRFVISLKLTKLAQIVLLLSKTGDPNISINDCEPSGRSTIISSIKEVLPFIPNTIGISSIGYGISVPTLKALYTSARFDFVVSGKIPRPNKLSAALFAIIGLPVGASTINTPICRFSRSDFNISF